VDIGPVITEKARADIAAHVEAMRAKGHAAAQVAMPIGIAHGTFIAPTIIEIASMADLDGEVFGPVLHVIRYRRAELGRLIGQINAASYGLTFGLHTRLDGTVALVTSRVRAGNLYVNRNMIGAVVGVQPFGGRGLSGTGPKAGGPLYLGRLVSPPPQVLKPSGKQGALLEPFAAWLDAQGEAAAAERARETGAASLLGTELMLPGPVGERNLYDLHPRGRILLRPQSREGMLAQMAAVLATGNRGFVEGMELPRGLPAEIAEVFPPDSAEPFAAALVEGGGDAVRAACEAVAAMPGPVVTVHASLPGQELQWPMDALVEEVSISINTTAAGGNASLMMLD
jgi:RHH-type proline utilization regulon transcriptional repressor/proline dehydrogenase/delta 1-pyrroline-5-carboxylate dehydrogenase